MVCSGIYASNFVSDRKHLWSSLCSISISIPSTTPWIVLGDFNETLSATEHSRSEDTYVFRNGVLDFQEIVSTCQLLDLAYQGPCFTWWNNQELNMISKKLDRALVNEAWLSSFPNSFAVFEAGRISDHARCRVQLTTPSTPIRRPFKFFNHITLHDLFLSTVADTWPSASPLFHSRLALHMFHGRQKLLKHKLKALNRDSYGDLHTRVSTAFNHLSSCQDALLNSPTNENQATVVEATEKWSKLSLIEEKFARQKSRVQWLKDGDHNTAFFHRVTQVRNNRNAIKHLATESGVIITEPQAIKDHLVQHYQGFMQTIPTYFVCPSPDVLSDLVSYRCPETMGRPLTTDISAAEVKSTLFSMPTNKAPGPDGFTMEFYTAAWGIIGEDFTVAVQSFFRYNFLPRGVNSTLLALVPKKEGASSVSDYRPISCCNLLYKVISKILARRLQQCLPEAIVPNQSAFVEGRLLLENVLLATELVKDYHKIQGPSRSALKLDISKEFDTIE